MTDAQAEAAKRLQDEIDRSQRELEAALKLVDQLRAEQRELSRKHAEDLGKLQDNNAKLQGELAGLLQTQ